MELLYHRLSIVKMNVRYSLIFTLKYITIVSVLLLLLQVKAFSQVTISSGNWSSPTTWQGGIIPGPGTNATINHAVVIDSDAIVGMSPSQSTPSSPAIRVNSSGSLTVNPGTILKVRGDTVLNDSVLYLRAGSTYEFDASQATTPQSARYVLQIGAAHNQPNARLRVEGTVEQHCTVRSNEMQGAAPGMISDGGFVQGGMISGIYTDFINIGDASNPAIKFANTAASIFTLERVTCDRCGALISTYTLGQNAIFSVKNVTWRNTKGTKSMHLNGYTPLGAGGLREVVNSVFDRTIEFSPPTGFVIENNILLEAFDVTDGPWLSFNGNFVKHNGQERRIAGNSTNNYWLVDNPSMVNPHFMQALTYSRDMFIEGEIFEFNGSDSNGDCILMGLPILPVTAVIRNWITTVWTQTILT